MRLLLLAALLIGCPSEPVNDDDDSVESPVDPCEDFTFDSSWRASPVFTHEVDPTDNAGAIFYEDGFDDGLWVDVSLPDSQTIPEGNDRAYRGVLELDVLPPELTLEPQSDDGIWLYVNGAFIGHWGGDWQTEGCVNEDANCTDTAIVPPQAVVEHLVVGTNLVAARVSNPLVDSFFDVGVACAP
jgi:hypothetical protein